MLSRVSSVPRSTFSLQSRFRSTFKLDMSLLDDLPEVATTPEEEMKNELMGSLKKTMEYGLEREFPGGRSSPAGETVAIFGASGFLGKYTTENFGTAGFKGYLPNRGCELEMRHLKIMFDLGMSWFPFYSPRDRQSIADAIGDADYVINLVGKDYETRVLNQTDKFPYVSYDKNFTFQEAHVDVPRVIAEEAAKAGVKGFVHVSSVVADANSSSPWARSKKAGEDAVNAAFAGVDGVSPTIVRLSQLFGPEDRLLNWFAIRARMGPVPLIDGGHALTRPVYMGDVADALLKIVAKMDNYQGKTFELQGDQDFTYRELAEFIYDITEQEPNVVEVPKEIMETISKATNMMPAPSLTEDQVQLWSADYVSTKETLSQRIEASGALPNFYDTDLKEMQVLDALPLDFKNLNMTPTPVENVAFSYLHRFRSGGHFINTEGYHTTASTKD